MKAVIMEKVLIVAGGDTVRRRVAGRLVKSGFSVVIAADGGYFNAIRSGILPDYVIGDFDSIGDTHFINTANTKLIKINRQTDTDVEKCLKFAVRNGAREFVLLGGVGNRLDHSLANFAYLLKFSDRISGAIFYGNTFAKVYDQSISFKSVKGEIISIYGFSDKVKVTSTGLKYKLSDSPISFGVRESTSNSATGELVSLIIRGGKVIVIREQSSFFL